MTWRAPSNRKNDLGGLDGGSGGLRFRKAWQAKRPALPHRFTVGRAIPPAEPAVPGHRRSDKLSCGVDSVAPSSRYQL